MFTLWIRGWVGRARGGWWITEACRFHALHRSKSVTRLELETIPMELKTMCRIPGMREMLRKFQGRLHLRAQGTMEPGLWLSLHQSGTVTSRTQSVVSKFSKVLFWDHGVCLLLDCGGFCVTSLRYPADRALFPIACNHRTRQGYSQLCAIPDNTHADVLHRLLWRHYLWKRVPWQQQTIRGMGEGTMPRRKGTEVYGALLRKVRDTHTNCIWLEQWVY